MFLSYDVIFCVILNYFAFFFFKQKTAYEMRISDWSSDVCSSDLGLDAALARLKPGGRLAVISFHSLEDRIVKQFINRHAKAPPSNRRLPVEVEFIPTLQAIGGARKADDDETASNPRARSAVLQIGGAARRERVVSVRVNLG